MHTKLPAILIFCLLFKQVAAQKDSISSDKLKNRKIVLASSSAALTIGSLVYLNQAWYSEYNTGKFHFFNDNKEWFQMDKAGHVYSNYQMSRLMMEGFEWAGFSRRKILFVGGTIGLAYMTAIEFMDGYSAGWGFSWGDEISNILGTGLAVSQQAFWKEQRAQLKFSFSQSGLAKYNPSLLGESLSTQVLKDYNGQTYWLSINPSSFMKKTTRFPKWLNFAVGYSAYGMLGGYSNDFLVEDQNGYVLKFDRERRFLLSLDLDLTRIKTKSRFLKGLFTALNMVKIPAPTLQFSKKGFRAYYLYF